MSDFIASSNCRGCRPKKLGSAAYYPRKHLVSSLMRDRNSIRFVVAPSYFGKSYLIAEYAELLFSFEQVFWIDGSKPCFLRDLDAGILFESFQKEGQLPSLIVIDDLAPLDKPRVDLAKHTFSRLVSLGCELIVSMRPPCDTFGNEGEAIVRFEAKELLLTDEEIDYRRTKSEQVMRPSSKFTAFERIPLIAWGEGEEELKILSGLTSEGLSPTELLACFVMIVLGRGSYEDVMNFIEETEQVDLDSSLKHYAYLGMNSVHEEFICQAFPLELVVKVFVPHLEHISKRSRFSAKGALVARLADAQLGRGSPEAACDLIRLFATASHRSAWLGSRGHLLLSQTCIYPAHKLYQSLNPEKSKSRRQLRLAEARRLYLLGQQEMAFQSAARTLSLCDTSGSLGLEAALLLARSPQASDQASARSHLKNCLAQITDSYQDLGKESVEAHKDTNSGFVDLIEELISLEKPWHLVALLRLEIRERPSGVYQFLLACFEAGARRELLTYLFLQVFDAEKNCGLAEQAKICSTFENDEALENKKVLESDKTFEDGEAFIHIEALIQLSCEFLNSSYKKGEIGFLEAYLAYALMQIERSRKAKCGMSSQSHGKKALLDSGVVRLAEEKYASLLDQRVCMEQELLHAQEQRDAYALTHPDGLRKASIHTQSSFEEKTPVLSVKLFGGLELMIGDSMVDLKLFSRQKTKVLLAILILNQGREISRERLSSSLWPESTDEAARRNLHSLWALLRKALKIKDGTCPYLIRTQFSYKLNTEFFNSDISEFNEICQKILFGQPQLFEWQHMYTRLAALYQDDILPTETRNNLILSAREELRNKFVETCSYAALRLAELNEYQLSLHFAQAALKKDVTREDAYALMMRGQIALGQRTAALDTYFRCRRYLSEELGIDPGAKTQELYLGIVVDDFEAHAYVPGNCE